MVKNLNKIRNTSSYSGNVIGNKELGSRINQNA